MRIAGYLVLCLCWFGPSPNVWAQTAVLDSTTGPTVTVTATKILRPLKESAQEMQVISREEIALAPTLDLAQLLHQQVGITVNGAYSNPGKDKSLFLRGAGNGYALILVDGLPLTDPSGVGGIYDLRLLSLDQVERIEILPGAQSTLYGSDAVAGVINIITRSPGEQFIRARVGADYGSFNSRGLQAGLAGRLHETGYQITYDRYQTDGISEALPPADSSQFDADGFRRWAGQVKLSYDNSLNLRIEPFIRLQKMEGDFDAGAFSDSPDTYSGEILQTGIRTAFERKKTQWHLNYQFNRTDRLFNTAFGESPFAGRAHVADAYTHIQLLDELDVLVGMAYRQETAKDIMPETDVEVNTLSPYAQLHWRVSPRWQFDLGARFNEHSSFGSQLTYSLAGAYDWNQQFRLFASLGTAFKAPTLGELFGPFGANPDLQPQHSLSWQAGARWASTDENIALKATFFSRQIEDLIVYTFQPGYLNQDEQNDYGVEVALNYRLSPRLSWQLDYTWLEGELRTQTGNGRDTTYNNLLRRPQHQLQLSTYWQPIDQLAIQLSGQYLSDRSDLFFNPDNFFAAEAVTLSSYLLVNAYAEYRLSDGQLRLFADVKNILNEGFQEVYGFSSLGRNIRIGLRWEMGVF